MDEDYYNLLGVSRTASAADIQKAYRSLARKYHPDVNPNDQQAKAKFQQIQKAYDVLNDPEKRELYDRYGSSFESASGHPGGPFPGGPFSGGPFSGGSGAGFEEFDFNQVFGGGAPVGGAAGGFEGSVGDFFRRFSGAGPRSPRRRPTRGSDLTHQIEVPFQTSIIGGEVQLNVQRPNGKMESITVKVPAGIEDGKSIRLRGQGETASSGGTAGDLLIKIRVAPHPCFRRQGSDLEVSVPVTIAEAALGAKIDLPTPKGTITLTIPAGTSSGTRLRVKGHGVQTAKGDVGDLFAEVSIVLADNLDEQSQALIRELAERNPQIPRRELRW